MIPIYKRVVAQALHCNKGISLIEILIAVIIIIIFTFQIIPWQISSSKHTCNYNRMVSTCRIIERQIEQQRILINSNPDEQFPAFKNQSNITTWDSTVLPPLKCNWYIEAAQNSFAQSLDNVCWVTIVAHYSTTDSLIVKTAIAKNF